MARVVSAQHRRGKIESGRRPVRVGQHLRASRNHSLARDTIGHGETAPGEPLADPGQNFLVGPQRKSQQLGGSLTRDIVGCRPQASSGEDEIRAVECGLEGLADGWAIGYANLPGNSYAAGGEFPGEVTEVGVGDEPEQKFGSRVDHLGLHQPRTSRWLQRLSRAYWALLPWRW